MWKVSTSQTPSGKKSGNGAGRLLSARISSIFPRFSQERVPSPPGKPARRPVLRFFFADAALLPLPFAFFWVSMGLWLRTRSRSVFFYHVPRGMQPSGSGEASSVYYPGPLGTSFRFVSRQRKHPTAGCGHCIISYLPGERQERPVPRTQFSAVRPEEGNPWRKKKTPKPAYLRMPLKTAAKKARRHASLSAAIRNQRLAARQAE